MYLLWYDDNAKKATQAKIEEAVNAYVARFKSQPNIVLVHETEQASIPGILVRSARYVRRNNFWVGWEEAAL